MTTITAPLERDRESASTSRWSVLAGAIIVQLILGTVYGYSIFWQPLQAAVFPTVITQVERAELVAAGQDVSAMTVVPDAASAARERQQQQGHLKYIFSICILSFAIVMVIAGRIQDVTGPRLPAIIGATLMGAGFVLAGLIGHPIVFYLSHAAFTGAVVIVLLMLSHAVFARVDPEESPIVQYVPHGIVAAVVTAGIVLGNQYVGRTGELDRLLLLWGTVGFLAGAGIGFAYVCPIAALVKWFPEQKGLVSGLAVAGFGFGAYLFKGSSTLGALGYIEGHGITSFFLIHGLICFVAITLGALLLRNPPDTQVASASDTRWQETLRRPAFYILWVMFFSGAMAGLMVIGIVKVFAGEQLVAAAGADLGIVAKRDLLAKGAEAVGWLAIFNAIGRIAWGFVSDRAGRTVAFVAMFLLQAAMMFTLAGMNTELSLAFAASIIGFNFGGNFALFPSATADLFGARDLGANYGWVFTAYGIAGVIGIAAGNTAKTLTGSYGAAFALGGALCVLSAVLALVLRAKTQNATAA